METKVLEVNKDESTRVEKTSKVEMEKTSNFGPGKIFCIIMGFLAAIMIADKIQDTLITREWIKGGMKPIPEN